MRFHRSIDTLRALIVDTHTHLFRTIAGGEAAKESYEIFEYGESRVEIGPDAGTVEQLVAQMARASVDRAFVRNLLATATAPDGTDGWVVAGDPTVRVITDRDDARAALALPGLSEEEQQLVLAGNALRLTGAAATGW